MSGVIAVPLVSIITPTRDRSSLLPLLWDCVAAQDYPNLEWLIEDDSDAADSFVQSIVDDRVVYTHAKSKRSVGSKRNSLVAGAKGEYVVHFDDDDYYTPQYVSTQVRHLACSAAGLVKLCGFYIYDKRYSALFYWDQMNTAPVHFVCKPHSPLTTLQPGADYDRHATSFRSGYGFSYVYRRSVWRENRFPDVDFREDAGFVINVLREHRISLIADRSGICVHIIHERNLSGCFPQYVIPPFLAKVMFPIVCRNGAELMMANTGS